MIFKGFRILNYQQKKRSIESDGLVIRTVYPEVPPRVEYSLSELGPTLKPILDSMVEWVVHINKCKKNFYGLNAKDSTLQLFHKKISYRTFWCIMNLTQNITKESDPVRQKHYTTKNTDWCLYLFAIKLLWVRQTWS